MPCKDLRLCSTSVRIKTKLHIVEKGILTRKRGRSTEYATVGPLQQKGWKPTTLLTFLARMAAKGALKVEKRGKQNVYTACVSSEQYRAAEAQELLTKLYSGNVKSMVAALYDGNALSGDQLNELRDWLESR